MGCYIEGTKAKSRKRPSHHPFFNDAISGTSSRARRETSKRQNQLVQGPSSASVLPEGMMPPALLVGMMPQMSFVHPAFSVGLAFYMPHAALFRRPDDMLSSLSSPLGQHILDYELPHGFVLPYFAMFDGSTDPYDQMLHYNQAMILNACNDSLCVSCSRLACGGLC